jgi:protein-S-isoprenylcysteine O-methyltransferase Ste14
METFRYIVALLLVILVPALCCYWLLLHGFLPLWKQLGISASQYLLWAAVLAVAIFISTWRDVLLAGAYGFQPSLATIGLVLLMGAIVFRIQIERFLSWHVQLGLPEIDPSGYAQRLITDGPYAHSRHPRYLQILVALSGWALLANYPAGYAVVLLWIPLMLIIVRLEEAELQRRFGAEYTMYRTGVARFWPHAVAGNHRVKA